MTILATITIIATLSVSMFFTQFSAATATTFNANKMTVTGVLASDSYVLFPYTKKNLIFGFSKYGELINGEVGQANGQGLEYNGLDVFANPNVWEEDWSQGWFIDIHYGDKDNLYKNVWAFAMYTDLTGTSGIGGDWQQGCTAGPLGAPHGGRKTNAWATTDPIQVLYDGPRRFVAITNTTIYEDSLKTKPLVSVTITFVFNKDKKVVILFKDIKRLALGKWGRTFQVEFSNRGEWDIGTTSAPPSYAHFYDDLATAYHYEYHDFYNATPSYANVTGFDVAQMINEAGTYVGFAAFWPQLFGKMVDGTGHVTPTIALSSLCTKTYNQTWLSLGSPSRKNVTFVDRQISSLIENEVPHTGLDWPSADPYPRGAGNWSDAPMVFKNGVLLTEGAGRDYLWYGDYDEIIFATEPLDTDYITVVYKHQAPTGGGADDMNNYVAEPKTPYVIGEWCFDLEDADHKRQFRAVTVYGLTDRHDGDDDDADAETWSHNDNVIDCEVQYYLNETFNPFDLYDAVHKQESRWLYLNSSLTTATSYVTLTEGLNDQLYYTQFTAEHASIGATSPTWTGYFLRDSTPVTPIYPVNSTWVNAYEDGTTRTAHSKNWCLELNATGQEALKITPIVGTPTSTAPLTLQLKDLVDFGFWYKMISGTKGPSVQIKVYQYPNATEDVGHWCNIKAEWDNPIVPTTVWAHYTLNNITSYVPGAYADTPFYDAGIGGTGLSGWHSFEYWTSALGEYYVGSVMVTMDPSVTGVGSRALIDDLSVAYLAKPSGIRYERVYNMEEDKLIPSDWDAYCSFAERVLINGTLIKRHDTANTTAHEDYYDINFETGNITFYHWATGLNYHAWDLGIGTHVKVLYSTIEENEKGRYEWMVLGKNARTVDSAAAAYVSEAFDSTKDIRVEMMGMDIREFNYGPNSPYVMSGPGTATRNDYNDSLGRPHLKDDWCTTWPVASSNMIFMAGPRANLGTEYMNEFTNAFFARSEYVVNNTGQSNTIMGLSCWNRNNYTSGYGVISVYKDLNGTVGLVFWGYDADDYYYTCKWFWSYPAGITCPDGTTVVYSGIEYLQHENLGVTDIILEITYPPLDPTHPTVEVSSERLGTISEKTQHDP
jgi:hypothetical protein